MSISNTYIIIPVYNERESLREIIVFLLKNKYTNIIIVDDGSSPPVFSSIQHFTCNYLRHNTNLGQGAALQTGFEYAKKLNAELVITFDADGQHNVNDIAKLIGPLKRNEADIVMGSRFLEKNNIPIPLFKLAVLKLARIVNYIFSGLYLSDAHNGLRGLNKTALKKICLTENRMAHASEFLFEIKKHKLRFKEVPVQIQYTKYAKKKGQSPWDSVKILFDLVLHKLFK